MSRSKKSKDKFKVNHKGIKEISDLLKNVPEEILGEIRARVGLYQTEADWKTHRYWADIMIDEIYKDNRQVGNLLKEGVFRVAECTKRFMVYDKCDNIKMCEDKCKNEYNFKCKNYIRSREWLR